jgi:hypothetical protein
LSLEPALLHHFRDDDGGGVGQGAYLILPNAI